MQIESLRIGYGSRDYVCPLDDNFRDCLLAALRGPKDIAQIAYIELGDIAHWELFKDEEIPVPYLFVVYEGSNGEGVEIDILLDGDLRDALLRILKFEMGDTDLSVEELINGIEFIEIFDNTHMARRGF